MDSPDPQPLRRHLSDGDSTLSNITDKLVPVISDGTPIIWTDDNDAHLEGLPTCVGSFINLNRGQDTATHVLGWVSYTELLGFPIRFVS